MRSTYSILFHTLLVKDLLGAKREWKKAVVSPNGKHLCIPQTRHMGWIVKIAEILVFATCSFNRRAQDWSTYQETNLIYFYFKSQTFTKMRLLINSYSVADKKSGCLLLLNSWLSDWTSATTPITSLWVY